MSRPKLLLGVGIIIVAGVIYFAYTKSAVPINNQAVQPIGSRLAPMAEPTPESTPTPTPSISLKKVSSTNNIPRVGGPVEGKITCNFLIPPAPNSYGTVSLESSWSNLVAGKNGYKADICVSTNGGATQTPVTTKTKVEGVSSDSINWISSDSNYIFTLFDARGGDLTECAGTFLSSCQIHTK